MARSSSDHVSGTTVTRGHVAPAELRQNHQPWCCRPCPHSLHDCVLDRLGEHSLVTYQLNGLRGLRPTCCRERRQSFSWSQSPRVASVESQLLRIVCPRGLDLQCACKRLAVDHGVAAFIVATSDSSRLLVVALLFGAFRLGLAYRKRPTARRFDAPGRPSAGKPESGVVVSSRSIRLMLASCGPHDLCHVAVFLSIATACMEDGGGAFQRQDALSRPTRGR